MDGCGVIGRNGGETSSSTSTTCLAEKFFCRRFPLTLRPSLLPTGDILCLAGCCYGQEPNIRRRSNICGGVGDGLHAENI